MRGRLFGRRRVGREGTDPPAPDHYPQWDREGRGSRFTSRVALAVSAGENYMLRAERGEAGVAHDAVTTVLGGDALDERPGLGRGEALDGSVGRGASGWAAVLEWGLQVTIGGVIGNAAWAGIKLAANEARGLLDRGKGRRVMVSRGLAGLVAIDHVLSTYKGEDGPLDIEAVEEPSSVRGMPSPEPNYVGIEPWLVLLQNGPRTARYVVAVRADGSVASSMAVPMEEFESLFNGFPPRD